MKKTTIAILMTVFASGVFTSVASKQTESGDTPFVKTYEVKEDAYVRKSRAGSNFNFENITKSHGSQYEGKDYRVINSKYFGSDEIIGIMKFDLPTSTEINNFELDVFEIQFSLFKNANYNAGEQDYVFRYTTDVSWDETTITWSNCPPTISRTSTNELFTFHIDKGNEYEFKPDIEKTITRDITEVVRKLVSEGRSSVTIFVTATRSLDSSILIHCKETSVESKKPRLIASNAFQALSGLVLQLSTVSSLEYTAGSYALFKAKWEEAKGLIDSNSKNITSLRHSYHELQLAFYLLVSSIDPGDADNVAYRKPARSNLSKQQVLFVNDGDLSSSWSGVFFPAYVDIDLMDVYNIEKIRLHFPSEKKTYYTLYGSNDGKNYDRIYQTRTAKAIPAEGELITFDTSRAYRIVRIYVEFTEGDNKAYLSEVKVYGTKTNTNNAVLRQGSLEDILGVQTFEKTVYNQPITEVEVIENVYGIIDRTIGEEYRAWFSFELAEKYSENDYFELSDKAEKIHIKGNEGLSLTTGLNYYFKNYLNVHVSEQTKQVRMPSKSVPVEEVIRKETPCKVRYAFNYCTLNYTFSFFGEEDWQRENDWLALNGVNVVLDLAGQEATWIKFLMNFGYSFDDAKDWLTGPAYYAWQFMDNMETFGGPVPDGYVRDRLELARSSQRWKRSLGMQTVLQGYAGMVPTNFKEYQPNIDVVAQGTWSNFSRPYMIATDSPVYDELARKFYAAQEFVYGKTTDYYAVDPFHEGGKRPEGLTDDIIAKEVLESLLAYDKEAVWIVQGWQSNPTNSLLKGMGEHRNKHVLIVDLVKYPIKSWTKYNKLNYGSTTLESEEFNGTNWTWCLLGNFGGNPTMNGQLDVMVEDILNARQTSKYMQGIGIISEGTYDNPILYDLIFDLVWVEQRFDVNQWIDKYIQRRYGGVSEKARLAWKIMRNSNYDHGVRHTNEVFGMKNKGPQGYGTQNISYGAESLETAFKLLLEEYDKFKDSECYRYDLTEIMRQVISNYAVLTYNAVLKAKEEKSLEEFRTRKADFLNAFDLLNAVQSTQKEQLGGEWIGKATDLARHYDDFSRATFEMNAKTLITTWGARAGHASLKDYGWRNYEGIVLDVYKAVWSEYLDKVERNLLDGTAIQEISVGGYFDFYWDWIMGEQSYTREVKDSPEELKTVADRVVEKASLTDGIDPNAGNLALKRSVKVNTMETNGRVAAVVDGSVNSQFGATAFQVDGQTVYPEVVVDLIGEFQLSKVNLLLDNTEGRYFQYEIYASANGQSWEKIGEKKTEDLHTDEGDMILVGNISAKFVKVIGTKDSKQTGQPADTEIVIKELRVYGERILPDLAQLERLMKAAKGMDFSSNSPAQISQVEELIQLAEESFNQSAGPDEVNTVYWSLYDCLVSLDLSGMINLAKGKPVEAHNGSSGNPSLVNDGEVDTYWDSGRLSPTGQPYQEEIVPGWIIVDLGADYDIAELRLKITKSNIWHMYEVYGSLVNDGSWTKIGEKTTTTFPNAEEDTHYVDHLRARYIKLIATNIQLGSDGKRVPYNVSELEVYGPKQ